MSQITKTDPLAWRMAGRRPAEPQQESSSASIGLMTIAREAHPAVSIPSGQPGVTRLRRRRAEAVCACSSCVPRKPSLAKSLVLFNTVESLSPSEISFK
jgi:hypothetical protein